MGKRYTTFEAIEHLKQDRKAIFIRMNDPDFEIYRNIYGLLMMKVGNHDKVMPIFNYLNDIWLKKQEI